MRNVIYKLTTLTFFALIWSAQSFAQSDNPPGVIAAPSVSIRQTTGNTTGGQTNYLINFKGGYRLTSGLYFGMALSQQIANGVGAVNQVAIGNSIGYYLGRVSLIGTYFLTATQSETLATGDIRRTEGSGFQADLSVLFPLSEKISFGPTLTYKTVTFMNQENSGGTFIPDKHTESYIYPYITMSFVF